MRYAAFFILFLIADAVIAQSPGLSVVVHMNGTDTINKKFLIEMRLCTPNQRSETESWSSHDTSAIDFSNLKTEELECGQYMYNGEGKEVLSGNKKYADYNHFEYSNQVFAWEKIIIIRVTNVSPGNSTPPMYMVMPVKYKSFVTNISLNNVPFRFGSVFYLDDIIAEYGKGHLSITTDLTAYSAVPVYKSPVKDWLK